ncbi:hypothetical protein FB451DRAFT_1390965 [Mycena latifolia]|nr:hypothetical protein FB451DRAFT_1390965 [Mycena latifolia]
MSLLPNAGIAAPIPDTFDFTQWMSPPASKDPTGRTLRIRNRHNVASEKVNEVSIDQTLNCKEDRVKHPDVGVPLQFFYGYTADDMTDMILSEAYCTDVGPLPAFIRAEVERARRKKSERTEADKSDKAKARPIKGSMVLSNPIRRVPGQRPLVSIPQIVLYSILHKLYVPLHWFSDQRLQIIEHRLHDIPTKLFLPEPTPDTPAPVKIMVLDMLKLTQDVTWGSDELSSCMSPLKWQQAAMNMEAALEELCEIVPEVNGVPSRDTFVSNFKKHRLFFVNYERFEENYADWYRFERQERHEILRGAIFDGDYYARQVDALLYAKSAAAMYII